MDDNAKHTASYHLDQEILDSRGIGMTVEEVAGLPTCKYSERVQSLKLNDDDMAFLKGLRRRIKNRLASQNSRRRSVEHLRRLTRELRAVRSCRRDALAERRALLQRREALRGSCAALRRHVVQVLKEKADTTEVPQITIETTSTAESQGAKHKPAKTPVTVNVTDKKQKPSKMNVTVNDKNQKPAKTPVTLNVTVTDKRPLSMDHRENNEKNVFECCIDKLVQQSVNHIYKDRDVDTKKVFAKTVFITNEKFTSNIKSMMIEQTEGLKGLIQGECEVLNLSVKEGRRRSHGRKQLAPKRIAYYTDTDDGVLDLKIKKEPQETTKI